MSELLDLVIAEHDDKMRKAVDHAKAEFSSVRTGRASSSLIEKLDVDEELGLVRVVQVATAQDVGKALNPLAVTGQIEGGIAQGLGLAVMEEIVVADGRIRNPSFTDYLLPTPLDMPPVVQTWIEQPEPGGVSWTTCMCSLVVSWSRWKPTWSR